MRVLVVSDTHGHLENLERALEETGPVDALMHCGDIEGQAERIRRMIDGPCYMVAGNNDWGTELRRELLLTLDDYRSLCDPRKLLTEFPWGQREFWTKLYSRGVQIAVFRPHPPTPWWSSTWTICTSSTPAPSAIHGSWEESHPTL